jgi:hypothetical protein
VRYGEETQTERGDEAADGQRHLVAEAAADDPRERAERQHRERPRKKKQPGASRVGAEPVARRRGRLRERRNQDERTEHPEADEKRRDVRHQDGRLREGGDVRERLRRAALERDPEGEHGEAGADQPQRSRAPPADVVRLGDRDQRQHEPDCEHESAAEVEARRRTDRRFRYEELRRHRSGEPHRGAEPEDGVVRGVVDEDSAEDQAEPAADPRNRREQPDAAGDALTRELVADDREAEWEDAAADTLHYTACHDDPEARRERRDDRAGGEREQRDH